MKKVLLLCSLLTGTLLLNAQTVVFENNFDTSLANLSIFDLDGDGDGGIGWYNVPATGFPPTYTGSMVVFDASEATAGYTPGKTYDINSVETKSPVTIPLGGSAKITFDLLVYGNSGSPTTFTTDFLINIYNNNTAYTLIAQKTLTVTRGTWNQISLNIPEGLGQSYIYELLQSDNPRVQSDFLVDNLKIIHTPALSSEDFSSTAFSLYPNPTTDVLNISNNNNLDIKNISVTDINGRIVKTSNSNEIASAKIDLSDLTAGIYIMKIETDKGISTEKIIKK
jgi:hypothetical protein